MEAAAARLADCSLDGFTPEELVAVLVRRERLAWRAPVIDHRIVARLVADGNPGELGAASLAGVLVERLRIGTAAARRRVAEAADLVPRATVTGQVLAPVLPGLAAAQAAGTVGPEQVEIVRKTYAKIPAAVDAQARERAEADLAMLAGQFGPVALQRLADHLLLVLDPDGDFSERERAARRGVRMGRQLPDGMSRLTGTISPELRAALEPILAKLAAPGMCNPADEHPCVSGSPSEAQILGDDRTGDQRYHDALLAVARIVLCSGDLGQLNGLPVSVIVTTTLAELSAAAGLPDTTALDTGETTPGNDSDAESDQADKADASDEADVTAGEIGETATDEADVTGADAAGAAEPGDAGSEAANTADAVPVALAGPALTGTALTAGGTRFSITDVLRMAAHAYHYLVIFDGTGRPLWLGRSKRLASGDQRIVLHARDRGCTRPGCTVSGYHTQAHHLTDWARGHPTDIDNLALACGPDNRMASQHHWDTHLNDTGRVEWIPPPPLDQHQPRVNPYHFIEDLITYHRRPPDTAGTDPPGPPESPDHHTADDIADGDAPSAPATLDPTPDITPPDDEYSTTELDNDGGQPPCPDNDWDPPWFDNPDDNPFNTLDPDDILTLDPGDDEACDAMDLYESPTGPTT